jgi:hypothetical protein
MGRGRQRRIAYALRMEHARGFHNASHSELAQEASDAGREANVGCIQRRRRLGEAEDSGR